MTPRRVLVTGASVAGPAVAYWLAEVGFAVTVVERAPELRDGGQNIDIRSTARDVVQRMGLEEAVRAQNTGEVGTRFVDEAGAVVSEFPLRGDGERDGPTAELEILRGTLARLLVDACPSSVDWRYGDHVTAVTQDDEGVDVDFAGGTRERFDLLVIAEGVGSPTRRLVFGGEPAERALGMYIAYGTISREPHDDDWWRCLVTRGGRQITVRPDNVGSLRATLSVRVGEPVLDGLDAYGIRRELCRRFADLGWEVPRILDGFEYADDLYVDWLRQVRTPVWHRGRVCLLGDAAWCVTPIGGGGTSLALTGAYVLAAFLSRAGDGGHSEAFTRYDGWMRPLIDAAQKLPPGVPRIAAPRSGAGVRVLRWGTKVAASSVLRGVTTRLTAGPRAQQELPRLAGTVGG
ncbi:FAD-dependent monooxygenase [Actinoplanes italicus]|uniref:2-polyprenyl-6-methoxyphenol hydroxylase-like FAD-dependent oxidoreductase n=1 Tax=Actinoplanes italicus TaxID=113567 RepID=A0A2T0K629_9ACTN|nr:FAD-dependent monooxygenase [Actinoplanes italicus]PRX18415.1 2-polyprenyl-6-methoxyphenol hydroxylase-like FAD-dependent oxidoreductase [Actinoplanes italicus]